MLFSRTFLGQGRFQGRPARSLGQGIYNPPVLPLTRWTYPINTPLARAADPELPGERWTTPVNAPVGRMAPGTRAGLPV